MSPAMRSFRSAWRQPAFVITCAVLLIAGAGLNGATQYLRLSFQKLPVELQRPVEAIPGQLGPWRQMVRDERLMPEIEEALGTKKYIMRYYYDTRLISPDQFKRLEAMSEAGQGHVVELARRTDASAVVSFAVTYYTGLVDTVAHIPDRCYTASGYEPVGASVLHWSVPCERPGELTPLDVRFIAFADPAGRGQSVPTNVAYVFHANGQYKSDPLGVRLALQNLREKYGYYAKVELMSVDPDKDRAARIMEDFMRHALPEVERVLPDWAAIKAGSNKP